MDQALKQSYKSPDFTFYDNNIQGQENLAAMFVGYPDYSWQIIYGEVGCTISGIKAIQTKVYGISPCEYCSFYGIYISTRRQ